MQRSIGILKNHLYAPEKGRLAFVALRLSGNTNATAPMPGQSTNGPEHRGFARTRFAY
jgi:hypothetical protein